LRYFQKFIADNITDEGRKADVFEVTGVIKADVFIALATAAATLGDKTLGLAYLKQAQVAANETTGEDIKANDFKILATAVSNLGGNDNSQALEYLKQLQDAAYMLTDQERKADVFKALATAAKTLGESKQALQFSQSAVNTAKQAHIDNGAFLNYAELNAQAGNYRTACNLAKEDSVNTGEALKILAVVLREYGQEHRL
jgi:hypothetical protein